MKQSRLQGIIIPTALLVAMFVLLISTVLVANVSMNLNMSLGAVEATESRYLSFAASNQMLSDLGAGTVDVNRYTRNSPYESIHEGYTSHTWVEPQASGAVLVVSKTFRSGQSKAETVKRLATYKDFDLTRVITNANDTNPNTPDPVYYSDGPDSTVWNKLPDFERCRISDAGTVESKPGEKAGTLFWVAGDYRGSLYGIYVPALDGWGDNPSGLDILPWLPFPWGKITLERLVVGTDQGKTIGDLTPVAQVLINNLTDFSVTKGAVMMKYDVEGGQWSTMPPPQEATVVNGQAVVQEGNFHVKGAGGVPSTYEGGAFMPVFRKGPDTIYHYREQTNDFEVMATPQRPEAPGATDVLLMAADQQGTPMVQSGQIVRPGILEELGYFWRILNFDFSAIQPQVNNPALHIREAGDWKPIDNPPAQFYKKTGELDRVRSYSSRGPLLGGMVGGENGEFFVVNRPWPPDPDLVDTVYKYSSADNEWQLVPSPPNVAFDPVTGNKIDKPGAPKTMELGQAASGKIILRLTDTGGPDPIFIQTQGGSYDLLPPVRTEGGPMEKNLAQIAGGRRREGTRGAYVVRATYF